MWKTTSTSPRFQQRHVDGRQEPHSAAAGTAGASPGTSRPRFVTFEMMDRVLESIAPVQAIPFNFVLHHGIKRLPCDPPRGHFYPVPKQHKAVPERSTGAGEGPPAAERAANAASTLPGAPAPTPAELRPGGFPRALRGGADSSLPRFLTQHQGKPRPPPAFPPLTGRAPPLPAARATRCPPPRAATRAGTGRRSRPWPRPGPAPRPAPAGSRPCPHRGGGPARPGPAASPPHGNLPAAPAGRCWPRPSPSPRLRGARARPRRRRRRRRLLLPPLKAGGFGAALPRRGAGLTVRARARVGRRGRREGSGRRRPAEPRSLGEGAGIAPRRSGPPHTALA